MKDSKQKCGNSRNEEKDGAMTEREDEKDRWQTTVFECSSYPGTTPHYQMDNIDTCLSGLLQTSH